MIIDFNRTVAYMCPGCGELSFGDFSLFELSGGRGISVKCDCGMSQLHIMPKTKSTYTISVNCLFCDEEHTFDVSLADVMKQNINHFSCPDLLVGLAFVGRAEFVKEAVSENNKYIAEIVSACGLAHTGKNGITMLKALEKIQELSDTASLYCSCDSNIIDVEVLADAIVLNCCSCGANATFTVEDIRKGRFSDVAEIVIQSDNESTQDKN